MNSLLRRFFTWILFLLVSSYCLPPLYAKVDADTNRQKDILFINIGELPKEARETLALIKKGGPFPYSRDAARFANRENRLPKQKRDYYREYTVPTPGVGNRGARRIITGMPGEYYYTDDHYASFKRIRE